MKKLRIVIAITFALSLNIEVIAQATNASLTGTVTDITGATVEDVVVTARNIKFLAPIPEPTPLLLVGIGIAALSLVRRRRVPA